MVPQRKLPEVIISTNVYKDVYVLSDSVSMNQDVTKNH